MYKLNYAISAFVICHPETQVFLLPSSSFYMSTVKMGRTISDGLMPPRVLYISNVWLSFLET